MQSLVSALAALPLAALIGIAYLTLSGLLLSVAWNSLRALRLRAALREKGYDWVTLSVARALLFRANPDTLRALPNREELASTPGYVEGDPLSLVDFAYTMERTRERAAAGRRARKRRG